MSALPTARTRPDGLKATYSTMPDADARTGGPSAGPAVLRSWNVPFPWPAASMRVGGLLSASLSGSAARVSRQGRGMLVGTMIWGAAIACFGATASLPLALAMLAVGGRRTRSP